MAIKVTGYFQNPTTGLIHQSPLLTLVPHLTYPGNMTMDVHIDNNGTVAYQSIDRNDLVYNPEITDGYSQLIDALETYVINHLQSSNDVNAASTFEHYVPPVIEPIIDGEGGEETPIVEEPVVEETSEQTTEGGEEGGEETPAGE